MAGLEVDPNEFEAMAQQARVVIEASLQRSDVDASAFWHAVALIYRRGLPASPPMAKAEAIDLAA
ncbi:hypothetical protein [Methylobacterium oxalidis]|uniref:hypothetical protein n=1 Tax=Methylobacterium oxalidis TaxID=944322 RepID=UPI003314BF50